MIRALCCECGTLREVSQQAFTNSGNRRLKCETCGEMTMHALLLGPRMYQDDWREKANAARVNRDRIWDRAGTQPPIPAEWLAPPTR